MPTFLELVGGLIDRWRGSNFTRIYSGNKETEVHHLKSKVLEDDFFVTITSRRIIYLTTYRRWWIPNRRTTVYEVVCSASPEVRAKLDPIFFKPVIYPLLCSRLLQWTPYPHIYAIHAFLGQIPHCTEIKHVKVAM